MKSTQRIVCLVAVGATLIAGVQLVAAEVAGGPMGGRGPEGRPAMKRANLSEPDSRLKLLNRNLNLSKEQQEKIKPILEEEYKQLEALRGNDTLNRDDRNTKLQALVQASSDKIKPLLTAEQQAKYEQIKQTIRERRLQNKGNRAVPPLSVKDAERRLNRLTRDLTLTKEQQDKIKPILDEETAQLDALRGNDTVSREERRTKLQTLNQATAEKIKPLLTADQQKKFSEIQQRVSELRAQKKLVRPESAPAK
jgi:Spy/CpxP family protein refolding chaperone